MHFRKGYLHVLGLPLCDLELHPYNTNTEESAILDGIVQYRIMIERSLQRKTRTVEIITLVREIRLFYYDHVEAMHTGMSGQGKELQTGFTFKTSGRNELRKDSERVILRRGHVYQRQEA